MLNTLLIDNIVLKGVSRANCSLTFEDILFPPQNKRETPPVFSSQKTGQLKPRYKKPQTQRSMFELHFENFSQSFFFFFFLFSQGAETSGLQRPLDPVGSWFRMLLYCERPKATDLLAKKLQDTQLSFQERWDFPLLSESEDPWILLMVYQTSNTWVSTTSSVLEE